MLEVGHNPCPPAKVEAEVTPQDDMNKPSNKGYNGWSNYETWLLILNLDNDYGLYQMMQEIVNDFIEDFELSGEGYQEDKHYYICNLDDIIKNHLEELFWIEEHNIFKICDTWTYRDWQEIDWYEIAESYLDDIN